MADKEHPAADGPGEGPRPDIREEAEAVIAALRQLWGQVTSPVIRECLEAARFNIAYLACGWAHPARAGSGAGEPDRDGDEAA